jgi:hypothetical protein
MQRVRINRVYHKNGKIASSSYTANFSENPCKAKARAEVVDHKADVVDIVPLSDMVVCLFMQFRGLEQILSGFFIFALRNEYASEPTTPGNPGVKRFEGFARHPIRKKR